MNERFCSLIVVGSRSPRILKLHLSRWAIAILVLAFLVSFLTVVLLGFAGPKQVDDLRRTRLKTENYALKMEALQASSGIKVLDAKVSELENTSKRLEDLVDASER